MTHSTCSWDEEGSATGGLEYLLHILKESLGQGRNSRGTIILIVPVHCAYDRFWDVDRPWNKKVVPSWSIYVIHLRLLKISPQLCTIKDPAHIYVSINPSLLLQL